VPKYTTQARVEAHLSRKRTTNVARGAQGAPDSDVIALYIEEAEAIFEAKALRGIYLLPLQAPIDPLAETVVLRIFTALFAERHPEVMRIDPEKSMASAMAWCDQIRQGKMQIGHALAKGSSMPDAISFEQRDPIDMGTDRFTQ
jgi:hypothetical protein